MASERQTPKQVEIEDALKHILDCEEVGGTASVDSVSGALRVRGGHAIQILGGLQAQGLTEPRGDIWVLTESGRTAALEMVRRHRLYETFLAREEGVPADEWHRRANAEEHRLDLDATNVLADRLGNPRFDPHGDPIPTREGELPTSYRVSLAEWDLSMPAIIDHVEDEPVTMYRKLVQKGVYAGMVLSEMEKLPDGGVRALVEGRSLDILPELLGLIHVGEVLPEDAVPLDVRRLSELLIGEKGIVYGLSASCYGPERRRLLDLGVVPGTTIQCEFQSPFGSPRSYLIRGTLFGFRDEQADKILLEPQIK